MLRESQIFEEPAQFTRLCDVATPIGSPSTHFQISCVGRSWRNPVLNMSSIWGTLYGQCSQRAVGLHDRIADQAKLTNSLLCFTDSDITQRSPISWHFKPLGSKNSVSRARIRREYPVDFVPSYSLSNRLSKSFVVEMASMEDFILTTSYFCYRRSECLVAS